MLEMIIGMAAGILGLEREHLEKIREELYAEEAAGGRYAATTALKHPAGSTTPLNKAEMLALNTYVTLRSQLEKDLPSILALMIATTFAGERHKEIEKARDRHWKEEYDRRDTGIHPAMRDHFKRLFDHGVHPHSLKQHRDEEIAILADLSRWKAKDPRYRDPDNPWLGVLELYSSRLVLQADRGTVVKRSVSGTPVAPKRYTDPRHYMFGDLLPNAGIAPPPSEGGAVAGACTGDEETGPADDKPGLGQVLPRVRPGPEDIIEPDPYELPADMPQAKWKEVMAEAERIVHSSEIWAEPLTSIVASLAGETDAAIIDAVAAAPDVPGTTPLIYFLNDAWSCGVDVGFDSYRETTVRRVAFELHANFGTRKPTRMITDARMASLVGSLLTAAKDDPIA